MRTITVYRVDYVKKTRVPEDAIHIVVESREAWWAWMPPNAVIHNSGEEY